MHIALLKRDFHAKGGLEKYSLRICEALLSRGHKVSLLVSGKSSLPCAVSVSRGLFSSLLSMVWFELWARFWVKKYQPHVVFGLDRHFLSLTHYRAGNGCHAAFLERRKKEASFFKKLIFLLNPLHLLTLLSEKKTLEDSSTKIICNSHLVRNEMCRFYPQADGAKIHVVHNGVEWKEMEEHFKEHKDLSIPSLLFVGHEWERKGLDRLLRALSLINETKFSLTAIGRERNPKRFERMVRSLSLQDKVILVPQAQPTLPFYQKASIMVIPSRYDPFANVTLEALAMGLFVVTTKANGGSEVITTENGIVLEEDASAEDFSKAVLRAFEKVQDPTLSRRVRNSVASYDFSYQLEKLLHLVC